MGSCHGSGISCSCLDIFLNIERNRAPIGILVPPYDLTTIRREPAQNILKVGSFPLEHKTICICGAWRKFVSVSVIPL